jgi:hypothetical protein
MCAFISTERDDAFRRFFVEVNKDPLLRMKFLENPVHVLKEAGLYLSPKVEEEVRILTEILIRKVPDIAQIPSEYRSLLDELEESLQSGSRSSRKKYEDDPMML